jgi:diguanylate cyclase (GGDEF)-like protein
LKVADPQRAFRKPFVAAITVTDLASDEQISAHTGDLSVCGCFVTTPTSLNSGAMVRITIVHAGARVVCFGDVAYIRADGVGITFTKIEQSDQAVLERWCELERSAEQSHKSGIMSPPSITETTPSTPKESLESQKPGLISGVPAVSAPLSNDQAVGMRKNLLQRDRKASWYWWNAVLAMLLLLGAIVLLSLPRLLQDVAPSFQMELTTTVRGLLGLALIFNLHTLYQQNRLNDLRNQLSVQMAIAAEHKNEAESLYELSVLDPLTGLFNRRFLENRLSAEMDRSRRLQSPLIVMLLDLDNFKVMNDRLGHAAGDLALKEFAHRVSKAIRGSDFAVRMGGDEFLVLLTECPPEKVGLVLSRLGPVEIDLNGQIFSVSGSWGWAQYEPGETAEQLIARADAALYANKAIRRKQG